MILAYIDPGTGSMVVQMLLASILSIPFLFRSAITRTVRRLRGKPEPEHVDEAGGKGEA